MARGQLGQSQTCCSDQETAKGWGRAGVEGRIQPAACPGELRARHRAENINHSNKPFIETAASPLCTKRYRGTSAQQTCVPPHVAAWPVLCSPAGALSVGEAGLVVHGEHLLQRAQVGSCSLVQAQVVPCSRVHDLLKREEL